MLIGIICLIVGTAQRSNLEPIYDEQLSNGIDCVIISVNQGIQCHQQKDGCLSPGTENSRESYQRRPRNGGPNCNEWNYKRFYYYEYQVALLAIDICNQQEIVQNGYHNASLITFDIINNDKCQDAQIYDVGNHFCYNVDEKCSDSTFELDTPLLDPHGYIQDTIIAGAVLLIFGGCCCMGWIIWAGWI